MKTEPQTAPAEASPSPGSAGIKRQSLWSMMPLLVISVVNIISVPMFLHSLGDERYALWNYVALLTGMFGFTDLGLGVVVGRYIGVALGKGDREAVRAYWGTGNSIVLPLVLAMAITFIVLGVGFGPKWFHVAADEKALLRACFVAGGFGLFFSYYSQFWNILAQAFLDFKFIGVLRTGLTLLQVVPSIWLAYVTRNPLWLIGWSAATAFLGLTVLMWHARRRYQIGFHFDAANLARAREMAPYAGKSLIGIVTGSFFVSIDRVILGRLAAPVEFNPYTISANLAGRLQGLSVAVMGPVFFNTNRVTDDPRGAAARIYNEMFTFVFEWYLLAVIWTALWHPVLLRLWVGAETGARAAPLIVPLMLACCISAVANISGSQLASLNRVGTAVGFSIAGGWLAAVGVWVGWNLAGPVGAAYGFLISRVAFLAQDFFTIRLIGGGGWLSGRTWKMVLGQAIAGASFGLVYFALPRQSVWLLIPAALHGGLVAAWLLRRPLRNLIGWRAAESQP